MRTEPSAQREAEWRARARGLRRDRSQRPAARLGRLRLPGERPAIRSRPRTSRPPTRRSPSPASARGGLHRPGHARRVLRLRPVGPLRPRPAQRREHARDRPPGLRQVEPVKTWMQRSRVFGRPCEMIDPKGEYEPLVKALGGTSPQVHARRPDAAEPAYPDRQARDARRAARGDRAGDARPAAHPGRGDRTLRRARGRRPPPDGAEVCIPDVVDELRTPAPGLADRLGLQRTTRGRSCGSSRSRCSASATARCAGCSTVRRPPGRTCSTRR